MNKTTRTLSLTLVAALFFICSDGVAMSSVDEPPELKSESGTISNNGQIKLIWLTNPSDQDVVVEQSSTKEFTIIKQIYSGPDNAVFISGLENGTYYYRVRTATGPWSDALEVQVKHHSLKLAMVLFSLGAVVFLLTVIVVIKGTKQTEAPG